MERLVQVARTIAVSSCLLAALGCGSMEEVEPSHSESVASGLLETVAPEDVGWSSEGLELALQYAREQRSSGLVVVVGDRVIAERYWEVPEADGSRYSNLAVDATADGRAIEDVASVQKSMVSFLVGVARGKGLLDLDAPVSQYLGVGWSKAEPEAEKAILVRHVMSMSSGLDQRHEYETAAGEKWMYNTNVYSRTCEILEAVSGKGLNDVTAEWLTKPIGMSDTGWGPRPWIPEGADANRIGLRTTARDLARFGVLMLAGGEWNGEDVLGDSSYLETSLLPSQEMNPAYGLLWWLNRLPVGRSMRGEEVVDATTLIPSAPPDLYAAQGALGRKLYVVPSLDLVVTRLGDQPEAEFNEELWKRLIAAAGG